MNLVFEDEDGAYQGVCGEFLKRFVSVETNPCFDVYDSQDNRNRFIAVKSSRLPDDEDTSKGRLGIDFNRAKPALNEALRYAAGLPEGYQWLNGVAFAAKTEKEYEAKASLWDRFYSFIWAPAPLTIWVAPHSGNVNRAPDRVLPFPKLMIDICTAGVAALCALKNGDRSTKRIMIAVHNTGHLGAVLNLGDFGILDAGRMEAVARKLGPKYSERVQALAGAFERDFCNTALTIVDSIVQRRGTADPAQLEAISHDDAVTVRLYVRGLRLYGQKVEEFTLAGFEEAMRSLGETEVPVITNNVFYTGRSVGKRLRLAEKIERGLLDSALVIECARLYSARDPELVSDIILDVKRDLFT